MFAHGIASDIPTRDCHDAHRLLTCPRKGLRPWLLPWLETFLNPQATIENYWQLKVGIPPNPLSGATSPFLTSFEFPSLERLQKLYQAGPEITA